MKEYEDDTNGKIFHAHGLEELILLKYLTIQSNLQIKYNLYQNSSGTFQRNRMNNPKNLHGIIKKKKSQSSLEKEQSWKHHASFFQTIVQSYSN